MNYIHILNRVKGNFSHNDKMRTFLAFINSIKTQGSISEDEKKLVDDLVDSLFLTPTYSIRLAKIINHLALNFMDYFSLNKLEYLFDVLISKKAMINFNHIGKDSDTTGSSIFHLLYLVEKNKDLDEENRGELFKDALTWISQTSDINTLFYSYKKIPLINYFLNHRSDYFHSLIFHISTHHEQYHLDLMRCNNLYYRDLFFYTNSNNEEVITLRQKIIQAWSKKDFEQTFFYDLISKDIGNNAEIVLYYNDEKTVQLAVDCHPDVFLEKSFDPLVILQNNYLSLKTKLSLLDKLASRTIPVKITTLYAGLYSKDKTKILQKQLIDFCMTNLNMTLENKKGTNLFHIIHANQDLTYIKQYIKKHHIKPSINNLGRSSLHYLALDIYDGSIEANVIEKMNYFLDSGVNIDWQTHKGNTALLCALAIDCPQYYIKALIEKGASLLIQNKYGKTPYDYFLKYKKFYELDDDNNFVIYVEKQYLEQLTQNSTQDTNIQKRIKI